MVITLSEATSKTDQLKAKALINSPDSRPKSKPQPKVVTIKCQDKLNLRTGYRSQHLAFTSDVSSVGYNSTNITYFYEYKLKYGCMDLKSLVEVNEEEESCQKRCGK